MLPLNSAIIARRAQRDARREMRTDAPQREPLPLRQDGTLFLEANGQVFSLVLKPDRRDCRRWYALRDGKPFAHGGLEQIWRELQRQMVPLMSNRNCC